MLVNRQKCFILIILIISLSIDFVTAFSIDSSANVPNLVVKLNSGRVRGSVLRSWKGNEFFGFHGMRYGEAPIGELRFQAPVPVQPWDHIFDASRNGPMCMQPFQPDNAIFEDCLRLNVFTKNLPIEGKRQSLKPVLILIPGGGFYIGSGASGGPEYLMDSGEILLVTINYRLGAFGLLSLGIKEAPGNAGFKDQVLAFKWVKENIEKFGGDPNSVTIVGNSAGAFSAVYHMLSPMSKGLFHKVILQSGGIGFAHKYPSEQAYLAIKQANILKCPNTESLEKVYSCLKTIDAKLLTDSVFLMFEFGNNPGLLWDAVVERDFGQERFLIEDPIESFLKGDFSDIPVIAGTTKDEFASAAIQIVENESDLKQFDENYETVFPICFMYESDTPRSKEISNTVFYAYNLSHPLTKEFLPNINLLFSDFMIGYTTHSAVKFLELTTNVYYYKFSYQGRYSYLYYPEDKPYGVVHNDDLLYLFVRSSHAPMFNVTDPEAEMVEKMTRMWISFTMTGNPNNYEDEVIGNIDWPVYRKDTELYLDILSQPIVRDHLNENRFKIYDNLFPLYR